MARMIPPNISFSCSSPGERLLFSRFRDDPATSNWIVLHSLGIAEHPVRREGEIDFVVLVPDEGILCLEVKAGQVARENGVWKYGKEPFTDKSSVGPFRQASEGMHAIRKQVAQVNPGLGRLLFFSGVFFTLIDFEETSPEWHAWQYADRSMLSRHPVSECCLRMLRKAHDHIRSVPSAKWYDPLKSRPTELQLKELVKILRGDFEYFISPRVELEEAERRIARFTEEQYSALDVLEENPRVVFKGPAGTGKTLLAIEAASRAINRKKRTLFVCYNRLLGHWLSKQVKSSGDNYELLEVGTLHQFLLRLSGMAATDSESPDFWTQELPAKVIERALEDIIKAPQFDYLVVDEAQDLVTEEYLDVMDLLLEGGLSGGNWAFFGDFERQAIYIRRERDGITDVPSILRKRSPFHFSFPLRNNCRNTEPIAIGLEIACGLDPGYSRILEDSMAGEIEVHFYRNADEQEHLLEQSLHGLGNVFLPNEIIVLSTREDSSSVASRLSARKKGLDLRPLRQEAMDTKCTAFTTIHAFKGLESPAVILTDVEKLGGDKASALIYVGMSRARFKLVMLLHENCRDDYMRVVQEGFLAKKRKEEDHGRSRTKSAKP